MATGLLETLMSDFASKTRDLKTMMLLRQGETPQDAMERLSALSDTISSIESQMKRIRSVVDEEKKFIPKAAEMERMMKAQATAVSDIEHNLPSRLPGPVVEAPVVPAVAAVEVGDPADMVKKPVKKAGPKIPKVKYMTQDQFDNIQSYARGRLTLDKINAAVDDLSSFISSKYKLLAKPSTSLGDNALRKVKDFRKTDLPELRGQIWFLETDLAKMKSIKMDNTGRSILMALKNAGHLRDHRQGGLTRYIVPFH